MINYIFGYGSLINKNSAAKTGNTETSIPCRVKGLRRSWTQPIPQDKVLALEVFEDKKYKCNGVLLPVEDSELPKFDNREAGYKRIKLDSVNVEILCNAKLQTDYIWVYVNDRSSEDKGYNIIQSYVDVIITGCLDYGKDFAQEFIKTTVGWDLPWINDRDNPIYPRALKNNPNKDNIDQLLKELIPKEFSKRKYL